MMGADDTGDGTIDEMKHQQEQEGKKDADASSTESRCKACGKARAPEGAALKQCSRCHLVRYCSPSCQVSDWKNGGHQFLCSSTVEVRDRSENNTGVFALRDIAVGEEIHREKPLMTYDEANDNTFAGLTVERQRLILSLRDVYNFDGRKSIQGIATTNGLPVGDGQGLFLLACRVNHACNGAANARYIWRADLGKMMLRAIRPIPKGSEVVACYLEPYMTKEVRQRRLREGFRFDCACSECLASTDLRDKKIEAIQQTIDDVPGIAEHEPRRALALSERLLEILQLEGLDTPLDRGFVHFDAFQFAARASDRKKMSFHIKKAYECALQTEGEGSELAKRYEAIMSNR